MPGAGLARAVPSVGGLGGMAGMAQGKLIKVRWFEFLVQFAWKPTPPTERLKKKLEAKRAEEGTGQVDATHPFRAPAPVPPQP